MIIPHDPELEAVLSDQAHRQGIAPEVLALKILRARFLPPPPLLEPQDEWERRLRDLAIDCGVVLSDWAVSSEGLYD